MSKSSLAEDLSHGIGLLARSLARQISDSPLCCVAQLGWGILVVVLAVGVDLFVDVPEGY